LSAPLFKQQAGEALIEALVSIVLLSVMMISQTYLVAKTAVSQKDSAMLNMALFQLRQQAQTQGLTQLCLNAPPIVVAGNELEISANCQRNAVKATFAGQTVNLPANTVITASSLKTQATEANKKLLGGDGVITLN
jgi:Tfp pilus assembly protein PilV